MDNFTILNGSSDVCTFDAINPPGGLSQCAHTHVCKLNTRLFIVVLFAVAGSNLTAGEAGQNQSPHGTACRL